MPQLILSPRLLLGPLDPDPLSIATVENIISRILILHSSDLEAFHLSSENQWRFTRDSVYNWVRCIAWRNVQHLTLRDSPDKEIPAPALFCCTRLITLTLDNYILSHLPTHFAGFSHLTICSFNCVELTDDSLACFISHCPLLRNLSLCNCVGLRQPTISAANITDLDVHNGVEILTVNCPKLSNMGAHMIKDLRVNGILFHELSCSIFELSMQCGSDLIVLKLQSQSEAYNFSAERFIEMMGSFKLLKELVIFVGPLLKSEKYMDICLLSLLERLPHLHRLCMGEDFLSEVAKYNVPPSLSSPLSKLRKINVYIDTNEICDREICVLACLLQSTPALQIMEFHLTDDDYESPMYTRFLEKAIRLPRDSKQAKIFV